VRVREPAETANGYRDGLRGNRRQSRLDLFETLVGPFADELRGDMQVLHRAPAESRRTAEPIDQAAQIILNRDG